MQAHRIQRTATSSRPPRDCDRCPSPARPSAGREAYQSGDSTCYGAPETDGEQVDERVLHPAQAEVLAPLSGGGCKAGAGSGLLTYSPKLNT